MDTLVEEEEEDVAGRRCVALPPVILKRPEYEKALSSRFSEVPQNIPISCKLLTPHHHHRLDK